MEERSSFSIWLYSTFEKDVRSTIGVSGEYSFWRAAYSKTCDSYIVIIRSNLSPAAAFSSAWAVVSTRSKMGGPLRLRSAYSRAMRMSSRPSSSSEKLS